MPQLTSSLLERGVVAGVDIGGTRVRMRLADRGGETRASWSTLFCEEAKSPEVVSRTVAQGLDACCREAGLARNHVLHLTAGAPGITDTRTGVVLAAPNLTDWNNVPLRALLQNDLGLPVAVENDVNLAALGEYHAGAAQGAASLVFLALGTGLGSGIVLRGQVLAGAHWSAGEVGYLTPRGTEREPPQMRKTGRLEDSIGGAGIEQRWQAALARAGCDDAALLGLRASHVFDRAAGGDPLASAVLQHIAEQLADAITDIALVLDPELVVLGGGLGSHPALCRATEACLARNDLARPPLRSSALGSAAQLAGAVAVSLLALKAGAHG